VLFGRCDALPDQALQRADGVPFLPRQPKLGHCEELALAQKIIRTAAGTILPWSCLIMPAINLDGKRSRLDATTDATNQYGAEEATRGERYLAVVVSLGFLFWLAMAFALGAWTT
jgi:hypothetical protein